MIGDASVRFHERGAHMLSILDGRDSISSSLSDLRRLSFSSPLSASMEGAGESGHELIDSWTELDSAESAIELSNSP